MKGEINTIPVDQNLTIKVILKHNLSSIELMRLEAMSKSDLNCIGFLREWLQGEFQAQTISLLDRGFMSWDDHGRLKLSSKSVTIVSITMHPIWIN